MRSALYTLLTDTSYINTDHLLAYLNWSACKLAAEPVTAGLNFVNQQLHLTLQKSSSDWWMTCHWNVDSSLSQANYMFKAILVGHKDYSLLMHLKGSTIKRQYEFIFS